MAANDSAKLLNAFSGWWREQSQARGARAASSLLWRELWDFIRDSTPARRRSRFGDMEYDWQHRVNTTSGTLSWYERLVGVFHSAYQPTDEAAFREMMAALPIDFREFTLIDIGSGKGRVLLMASAYPFRKIIGLELLAKLHRIAQQNIAACAARNAPADSDEAAPHGDDSDGYDSPRPPAIESVCVDAREFTFPETPLVVYLFNPLLEAGFRQLMRNLESSYLQAPRPIWLVYHNPVLEHVLGESRLPVKRSGQREHSIFEFRTLE